MRLLALALFALSFSSAHAQAVRYTIDPNHANVMWKINHMGFSNPSGKFTDVSGYFEFNQDAPEQAKVDVTIQTRSINTGIPKFDEHLRSNDFFFVDQYPTITFVSKRVDRTSPDSANILGDLTMHGITKPLTLRAKLNKVGVNPMTNKKTAGFSLVGALERDDFGMNFAAPFVGNDVTLDIEVEGIAEDAAPAETPTPKKQ